MENLIHSNWMNDKLIQQKPFSKIVLPGSHDSAAYSLTYDLSEVIYSNIKFLWELDKGESPGFDSGGEKYYVGEPLYNFIFEIVMSVAKAGEQSIFNQLNGGIRYFDLRVYRDSQYKSLYTQHGLRGCSLKTILKEVGRFISSVKREIVILDISPIKESRGIEDTRELVNLIDECIGRQFLYKPLSTEKLSTTLIEEITASGPKVIVLGDGEDSYPNDSPVFTEELYQRSGRHPDGVNTVSALSKEEEEGLKKKRTSPFYQISWSLTPQVQDIARDAISRLAGKQSSSLILQNLAKIANSSLKSFTTKNKEYSFQLITVDWYETSPVVDLAIEFSRS